MKTLDFFKIDWAHTRSQNRVIILFGLLAVFFSVKMNMPLWALVYLGFGAIILATTPFQTDSTAHVGFVKMLPATDFHRVSGRFLFTLVLSFIGLLFGAISVFVYYVIKHSFPEHVLVYAILLLAAELIVNSIQCSIFYALGNVKSQQLMGIIRLVPGFLMFFGFSVIIERIDAYGTSGLGWIQWAINHPLQGAMIALGVGIVIFLLGIFVSKTIVSKKDFI